MSEEARQVIGWRGQIGVGDVAPFALCLEQSAADGLALSVMGKCEKPDPWFVPGLSLDKLARPIPTPIVGDDDFPRWDQPWQGLPQACDARSDATFLVVRRDDDRKKWLIHSALAVYGVDRSCEIIETFDVQFVNNMFIR